MERSTIFNGKIHYKWPFSIAMLVHQRVLSLDSIECSEPILEIQGPRALGTSGLRLVDTLADLDEFPTAVISSADPRWHESGMEGQK